MAVYTSNWIHIGNFAEMDTVETNFTNENDALVIGTYDNSVMELIAITVDDANNSGTIRDDDNGGTAEDVSYTLSGTTFNTYLDAEALYHATVTFGDGHTENILVEVYQLGTGEVFISLDSYFDGKSIQQIELTSFHSDNYSGVGHLIDFGLDDAAIVCFANGTLIETAKGDVKIDDLAIGDMIKTQDHGMQPIRWIGSTTVKAVGKHAPVVIKQGTLDNTRDLRVSPQHRMLLSDWRAEMLFGEPQVLSAAIHLVNDETIRQVEGGVVEYFHILFDIHEIIFAEGAAAESFHPGKQGMGEMADETREEIFGLFPELRNDLASYGPLARPTIKAFEAKALFF